MFNRSLPASTLLTVTAVIELGAGLPLLCFPSVTVALLVGARLEAPEALTVVRVAGVALLTLSVACWLARGDAQSRTARGLVAAMVLYNSGVALILGVAGIQSHLVGVALWPAVLLHIAMTVWCVTSLVSGKPGVPRSSAG
jgi:hypothetical protein